jgi:hypothetical protein
MDRQISITSGGSCPLAHTTDKSIQNSKEQIMTRGLRIAHKYIWLLLFIVVPVLIVFVVNGIEEPILMDADVNTSPGIANIISLDDDRFFIGIDKGDSISSLEIIVKKPLKSTSSSVFGIHKNHKTYIGNIDKKGVYEFQIYKNFERILIVDGIKEAEILNQKLKWR